MKTTTRDIAKAAIAAAFASLEENGLGGETSALTRDLRSELSVRSGSVVATLTTPKGDAGPAAEKIRAMLEKKLGKSVELTEKADTSLIGGAVLTFGDERIDLSVKGSLAEAMEHLSQTASH